MKNVLVIVLCLFATISAWVGFDLGRKKDDVSYKIGAMLPCLFLAGLATWIGRKPKPAERNPKRRRSRDDWDDDEVDREERPRRRPRH
jgi:hypothetical protein